MKGFGLIGFAQGHAVNPKTPDKSGVKDPTPECSGVGFGKISTIKHNFSTAEHYLLIPLKIINKKDENLSRPDLFLVGLKKISKIL